MEFWFSEFHTPDVKHSIRVNKQLYSKQSDYQRIDIFETPEFGADQQFLLQFTFQGRYLLTQRRLCDMQDFSGLGQTADIDDFHKILQSS